jgi:hypothetical protein
MEEIHQRSRHNHQVSRTDTKTETVLVSPFKSYQKKKKKGINISSSQYWSVLCLSTPIFWKLGVKLGNKLQFKCDLEKKHILISHNCKSGKPM